MTVERVLIMGAAGRDFHTFHTYFRDNPDYEVIAFTAAQIPGIAERRYPPALSGAHYPDGIPIYPEEQLETLIHREHIHQVIFAYSDVSHLAVMHLASRVLACGADFRLIGPDHSLLTSSRPVISVCAVRTGCGKGMVVRRLVTLLRQHGLCPVVVRHPMPYGDLEKQAVQRFATVEDCDRHECTLEEREEYEQHIRAGVVVYAGVDYERILRAAEDEAEKLLINSLEAVQKSVTVLRQAQHEREICINSKAPSVRPELVEGWTEDFSTASEIILWDGGNNDWPFFRSDLEIVLLDPHRAGHEVGYHPGETNVRRAQILIVNKLDSAPVAGVQEVLRNIAQLNPSALVIQARSAVSADHPELIRGKRMLVIEDGPTLTHGEMGYGSGVIAAQRYGAAEIVDPRPFARGSLVETFSHSPWIVQALPAMGYSLGQLHDLAATIAATPRDTIVVATPVDLSRLMALPCPACRVSYELEEISQPELAEVVNRFVQEYVRR